MAVLSQFTAAEAAFVLREPLKSVKKAMDAGPVRPVLQRRGGIRVRTIRWPDLVYLFAVRELRSELTPKARGEFYEALQDSDEPLKDVRFGRFDVAIADLIEQAEQRTAKLAELAENVEFRDDGEPLIKGSGVEVYRLAGLLDGGLSVDEVLADYPSLSRDAVETARAYAQAYPKTGRPYPRTTAKRALRGAGLEALDEVLGGDAAAR